MVSTLRRPSEASHGRRQAKMSRVATRDPPSAPELTMVLAGSKPAPGSSWAHINAALSELIDANRQMEFKKSPGSRLRPPFFGVVTFFYTVADAARWRRLTRQAPQPPAQERTRNGQQVFPATRSRRTPKAPWRRPGALRLSSPRLASGASRRRSGDGVATRVARVVRRPRRSQGVRRRMPRCRGGAWTSSGPRAVTSRGSRHKDVFLGCVSLVKGVSGCLGFTPRLVRAIMPMGVIGKRRGVSCRLAR
mmetsp:Transcript_24397/g.58451  ORF Transcript_24397/g.58451 Transcript_24397/m.58451 type:complete len:249 (-) Transcript_24397:18-764(-)